MNAKDFAIKYAGQEITYSYFDRIETAKVIGYRRESTIVEHNVNNNSFAGYTGKEIKTFNSFADSIILIDLIIIDHYRYGWLSIMDASTKFKVIKLMTNKKEIEYLIKVLEL